MICKFCGVEFLQRNKTGNKRVFCDSCFELPRDVRRGKVFNNSLLQKCAYCGKEFFRDRKTKYCCEECSKSASVEMTRTKRRSGEYKEIKRKAYQKVCEYCGKQFDSTVRKARYCSTLCSSRSNGLARVKNKTEYRGKEHLRNWAYRNWRSKVFERDSYRCINCGYDKGKSLIAHHVESWNANIDSRYDVNNGATLCTNCHDGFHKKYGFGNNTKIQFVEYIGGGTLAYAN